MWLEHLNVLWLGLLRGLGGTFLVLSFILYEIDKRIKIVEKEIEELKGNK